MKIILSLTIIMSFYITMSAIDITVSKNQIKQDITPLMSLILNQNSDINIVKQIQTLIDNGSDINVVTQIKQGFGIDATAFEKELNGDITALSLAYHLYLKNHNYLDIVKLLIKNKADTTILLIASFGKKKDTIFFQALKSNEINLIKLMIENGADVNTKDYFDYTPLLLATKNQNIEVVKFLLKNKAKINDYSFMGFFKDMTSIEVAAQYDNKELISILKKAGSKPRNKREQINSHAELRKACVDFDFDLIKLIIKLSKNVDKRYMSEGFHRVIWDGRIEAVKYMIDHGVDVNILSDGFFIRVTPIESAQRQGHIDVIKLLIKHGSKVSNINLEKAIVDEINLYTREINGFIHLKKIQKNTILKVTRGESFYFTGITSFKSQLSSDKKDLNLFLTDKNNRMVIVIFKGIIDFIKSNNLEDPFSLVTQISISRSLQTDNKINKIFNDKNLENGDGIDRVEELLNKNSKIINSFNDLIKN